MTQKRKKKILYVLTKSNFGGAQRYVYDLVAHLPSDTYEAVVAFGGVGDIGSDAGTLQTLLEEKHIRTAFIKNFARDIFLFKEVASLFELISLFIAERPDIVHVNSSKAGGLGAVAARLTGVRRIIFTAHGWPHQESRNWLARALIRFFSWLTVFFSHTTIVVSHNDKKTAPAWGMQGSIIPVHNGIACTVVLPTQQEARSLLQDVTGIDIPQNKPWVITVAEFTKNKNLHTLISAFTSVPDAILIVIGDGELAQELKSHTESLRLHDRVFFVGFVPHADTYLTAADVFVLPSRKEGLPYAILEAGHAAVPVVASNVGGIPEMIVQNETGILIDPHNPDTLKEGIITLTQNPEKAKELAANLKNKVEQEFSIEQMLEETIALY